MDGRHPLDESESAGDLLKALEVVRVLGRDYGHMWRWSFTGGFGEKE